jgi:hypothetical protein
MMDEREDAAMGVTDPPLETRWIDAFKTDVDKDERFERQLLIREILIILVLVLFVLVRQMLIGSAGSMRLG